MYENMIGWKVIFGLEIRVWFKANNCMIQCWSEWYKAFYSNVIKSSWFILYVFLIFHLWPSTKELTYHINPLTTVIGIFLPPAGLYHKIDIYNCF